MITTPAVDARQVSTHGWASVVISSTNIAGVINGLTRVKRQLSGKKSKDRYWPVAVRDHLMLNGSYRLRFRNRCTQLIDKTNAGAT
jgi:hypothetical protein